MSEVKERIKKYLEYSGISIDKFENTIGLSPKYFDKVTSRNNDLTEFHLVKIFKTYPDLNPCWLFTGAGDMTFKDLDPKFRRKDFHSKFEFYWLKATQSEIPSKLVIGPTGYQGFKSFQETEESIKEVLKEVYNRKD